MDGDGIGAGNIDGELDVLSLEKTADIAFRILTGDFLKEHIPHLIVAAEILYFVDKFKLRHGNAPLCRFASVYHGKDEKTAQKIWFGIVEISYFSRLHFGIHPAIISSGNVRTEESNWRKRNAAWI